MNETQAVLRRALPEDRDAILSLLTQSGLPVAGVEEHLEEFHVVAQGSRVLGAIGLEPYPSAGLLRSAVVGPSIRGQGWGQRLVAEVVATARARGWRQLILLTETARDWFPRFGFRLATRDEVPADVQASVEFQGACPQSASVMILDLQTP